MSLAVYQVGVFYRTVHFPAHSRIHPQGETIETTIRFHSHGTPCDLRCHVQPGTKLACIGAVLRLRTPKGGIFKVLMSKHALTINRYMP